LSEHQTRRDEALRLAKTTRQDLFEEKKPITNLLLQCKTICRYLGISDENEWIDLELDGYYDDIHLTVAQIRKYVPSYRLSILTYFDTHNQPILLPYNIMQAFALRGIQQSISELEPEEGKGLTIIGSGVIDGLNKFLKEKTTGYYIPEVYKAVLPSNQIKKIVVGVRKRIGEFIDKIILELEYGGIPEHIFENIRQEVDHKLVSTCPNAIEKLKVTYERLSASGNPEDWSHVATSCRRIIKDVADILFSPQRKPVTDKDGEKHPVNESASINRIITAIKSNVDSRVERSLSASMINYVDAFLREIQRYASKGDHADFTKTDAIRCVVYTYLLLGDILHYYYKVTEYQ
jgi:AbiTii-like protein